MYIFDADDILLPGMLGKMLNLINEAQADMVIGDYEEIDKNGRCTDRVLMKKYVKRESDKWCCSFCPPLPGTKIIRKSILDYNQLMFENLKIGQDLNFFLKVLMCCSGVEFLGEAVMGYRIVEGSISRQYSRKILDICNAVDHVKDFYYQNKNGRIYEKYLSAVELVAYRSQMEKLLFFERKEERKEIRQVLTDRANKIKPRSRITFFRILKEKLKIKYLLLRELFMK